MRFGRNFNAPILSDDQMRSIRCIREMAVALVLARTGTEFDDGVMENVCGNVASITEELQLSPDDIQRILVLHEPTLAPET